MITSSPGEQRQCLKYLSPALCKVASKDLQDVHGLKDVCVCDLHLMVPRMNAMCHNIDVCL